MTQRTLSLLFDDDVYRTFVSTTGAPLYTIDEALKGWQEGRFSASLTRRFISQHLAAMTTVNRRAGGVTPEQLVQHLRKLAKDHPDLYKPD